MEEQRKALEIERELADVLTRLTAEMTRNGDSHRYHSLILEADRAIVRWSSVAAPKPETHWLSESFGRFLRVEKGYTDEQIAAECAANGLPPPTGIIGG